MIIMLQALIVFSVFLLIRNNLVYQERQRMIDYYFHKDPDGYPVKGSNMDSIPGSYEKMLFKFWVWPISSFYPAYHQYKISKK